MFRTFAMLLAGLFAVPAWGAPPADMAERLAACGACHGEHGEGAGGGEYVPHLSGKFAGYLREQLQAFRDGRRRYAQMTWLVRNMDDAWLERIAAFYAGLPPILARQRGDSRQSAALDARARQLVEHGDAALGVPACSACHGANLAGLEPGVPALVGLPADYVVAQLGAWRTGVRNSVEPDCMEAVALALSASDLRALGNWLAARGNDEQARPAAAGSLAAPMHCGSIPGSERVPGAGSAP